MMAGPERLAFISEWVDPVSSVAWTYQLIVFPETKEVELFDVKNRRTFLRKSKLEDMKPELFFVGGKVTIFGRQLDITDYGDTHTKKASEGAQQKTLAMVKPDAVAHISAIVASIEDAGFLISKLRMCRLSKAEACAFYEVHRGKPFYETLTEFMSSGPVVAMDLVASGAIAKWRQLIGPTNSETARTEAPQSLRALYGTDNTQNACHGSDAPDTASQECGFFFGSSAPGQIIPTATSTCAIIKPHVLVSKQAGAVLSEIARTFDVKALELFNVGKRAAAEFYEVYRGVVATSEYTGMVDELTSGPCLVVEVASADGGDAVEPFRQLCGPADPEIAAALRPHSLRARFGVDKSRNAVHCTDLQEDGPLEVGYFFQVLPRGG